MLQTVESWLEPCSRADRHRGAAALRSSLMLNQGDASDLHLTLD